MAIQPLFDRIVVKRTEGDSTTLGGIFLPEAAQEKRQEGVVIAAGTGRLLEDGTLIPLELKGGEKVLFGKYSGSEVKLGAETYLIMREEEVLAVLND